jgi:hypothetical protein
VKLSLRYKQTTAFTQLPDNIIVNNLNDSSIVNSFQKYASQLEQLKNAMPKARAAWLLLYTSLARKHGAVMVVEILLHGRRRFLGELRSRIR